MQNIRKDQAWRLPENVLIRGLSRLADPVKADIACNKLKLLLLFLSGRGHKNREQSLSQENES